MKTLLIVLALLSGCRNTLWECKEHNPQHIVSDQFEATQKYGCKEFKVAPPMSRIPEPQVERIAQQPLSSGYNVGDCVRIIKGVFKGQYWRIIEVNADSTFDIKNSDGGTGPGSTWIVREVRGSYLIPADESLCYETPR